MSLFDEIRVILCEQMGIPPERVIPESVMAEHLFMDYVDIVQLAIRLEVKYNISITDEELERIITVGNLVEQVGIKLPKAQGR